MGCRIAKAHEVGWPQREWYWMYCSTVGMAFGPSFDTEEECREFMDYCPGDPRHLPDGELHALYVVWLNERGKLSDFAKEQQLPRCVETAERVRAICRGDDCRRSYHKAADGK